MEDVTLPRSAWDAVARQLDAMEIGEEPSGLHARIAHLLADVPAAWDAEPCTLALDPPAAATVRALVRRSRGRPTDPGRAQAAGLAAAEQVIRDHQRQSGGPVYRIEHRSGDTTTVLGHTTAAHARQADLSQHAARLMASGATGELVLVDEATGVDVARRHLLPAPDADAPPADPR